MRVIVQDRECYELSLNVLPIECLDNEFQFKLTRRWKTSKRPTEDHVELDMVMTSEELNRIAKFLASLNTR